VVEEMRTGLLGTCLMTLQMRYFRYVESISVKLKEEMFAECTLEVKSRLSVERRMRLGDTGDSRFPYIDRTNE
jgi:hypothetical protein